MALCHSCANFSKRYDEFRALYEDVDNERDSGEKHYCQMYDDTIPNNIYYQNGDCAYYLEAKDGAAE